jgi:hypothetical protein
MAVTWNDAALASRMATVATTKRKGRPPGIHTPRPLWSRDRMDEREEWMRNRRTSGKQRK